MFLCLRFIMFMFKLFFILITLFLFILLMFPEAAILPSGVQELLVIAGL